MDRAERKRLAHLMTLVWTAPVGSHVYKLAGGGVLRVTKDQASPAVGRFETADAEPAMRGGMVPPSAERPLDLAERLPFVPDRACLFMEADGPSGQFIMSWPDGDDALVVALLRDSQADGWLPAGTPAMLPGFSAHSLRRGGRKRTISELPLPRSVVLMEVAALD